MKLANTLLTIVAFLGAALSGAFYYATEKDEGSMVEKLRQLQTAISEERGNVKSLRDETKTLAETLKVKDRELEDARSQVAILTARANQLKKETARFSDELDKRIEAEETGQRYIADLKQTLAALRASSVSIDELKRRENEIASLQAELLKSHDSQTFPGSAAADGPKKAPANLKGKVVLVGAQSSFVVTDLGYERGIRLSHALSIEREGQQIATLQVTSVKENLSVARILPESLKNEPQIGDYVISN